MFQYAIKEFFVGLWPLVWHFGILIGCIILALAWAWFMPVFKKTALWVALSFLIASIFLATGVKIGEQRIQAQWHAAIKADVERGTKARTRAERDVSRGVRNDKYDRDRK